MSFDEELCRHEIDALRTQLTAITKELSDAKATVDALRIRVGGEGVHAWGEGFRHAQIQAAKLCETMAETAKEIATHQDTDEDDEAVHEQVCNAAKTLAREIRHMVPDEATKA